MVGPSYQQKSLVFDAQRSINLFPVLDEQGKEVAAMYGTPGKNLFVTAGLGPIRGSYYAANGRAFVISGSSLYEITSLGVATNLGSLNTSSGTVTVDENGFQLGICDGASVYILTYATNVFAKVTDVDLPSASTLAFIDGYFVINKTNSGQFNISAQYDGTSWAALDFATAESSPDNLLRVFNAVGQLWLFGATTTEIWTNTGAAAFPFQKIAGAKLEVGIAAPYSAVAVDNSVLWVGQDRYGRAIVYRANGFSPQRISTEAIELLLQAAGDLSGLTAYSYQELGHVFYVLTGGSLATTLVYDISTQQWHERAYLNAQGNYELDLGTCHMFAFGYHLLGDRLTGNVYTQSLDIYSDNGNPLCRERIYTHLGDENKRIRYNNLEIGFETGVGLQSGQGSNPTVSLQLSKDGARTWSQIYTTSIGAVGNFQTKARFRRLGIAEIMTFRIRITDPVKVAIVGSYLT